jgi:hypothetical protein
LGNIESVNNISNYELNYLFMCHVFQGNDFSQFNDYSNRNKLMSLWWCMVDKSSPQSVFINTSFNFFSILKEAYVYIISFNQCQLVHRDIICSIINNSFLHFVSFIYFIIFSINKWNCLRRAHHLQQAIFKRFNNTKKINKQKLEIKEVMAVSWPFWIYLLFLSAPFLFSAVSSWTN